MTSQTTFFFSQVQGRKFVSVQGTVLGRIVDLLLDLSLLGMSERSSLRPKVIAVKVIIGNTIRVYDFSSFEIKKHRNELRITCFEVNEIQVEGLRSCLWIGEEILGKKIVDIDGRKLEKVNGIRLVLIPSGTYAIAVDVGLEAKLRSMGILDPLERLLDIFHYDIPGKLILWEDLEAVEFTNANIRTSKAHERLNTMHPSDLADIIEEMDIATRASVFAMLDEDKAADVLEEMEPEAQVEIVGSLPISKVADVLEKMPADEVADLLDELNEEQKENLLKEMEKSTSEEVRELLEYSDKEVGSIMTTDFFTFPSTMTVEATLREIHRLKPEPSHIYSIFVVDAKERLLSSISLMKLVLADPHQQLGQIMDSHPVTVYDTDDIDSLAELVSKYNLLAVPVINKEQKMEGVVVVEDIVEDLLGNRKTR
jgi:magnesium transporter